MQSFEISLLLCSKLWLWNFYYFLCYCDICHQRGKGDENLDSGNTRESEGSKILLWWKGEVGEAWEILWHFIVLPFSRLQNQYRRLQIVIKKKTKTMKRNFTPRITPIILWSFHEGGIWKIIFEYPVDCRLSNRNRGESMLMTLSL